MEEDLNSKGTFNPPQDSQPTRLGLSTEELSSTGNSQSSNSSRNIISSKFKKLILSLGKRGLGLLCLFGVVSLWVGSSVLMQFIFTEESYKKPFFLTYFNTSLFSIYLLGFIFRRKVWMNVGKTNTQVDQAPLLFEDDNERIEEERLPPLTLKQVMQLSLLFCPIWFIDNYTFNLSLTLTSVSSNTILSSTSALWTLFLGILFKIEKFDIVKLLGVLLTFGGVVLVSLIDNNNGNHTLWGDFLSLVSAFTYGIYVVLFKKLVVTEDRIHNSMFLGFMGLFNVMIFWILGIVLDLSKIEILEVPKGDVIGYLLLNGLLGSALSDYLWLYSVLLISPVVSTVGLSLTIPMAMITDWIIKQKDFQLLYIFGSLMVALGFVVVNLDMKTVIEKFRTFNFRKRTS